MKRLGITVLAVVMAWASLFGASAMAQRSFTIQQVDVQPAPIDENWEKDCLRVDEKLVKKVAAFTERRDAHLEKYRLVVEKLEIIIGKLDAAGFDTTSLQMLMPELENRITIFDETATLFIAELESAAEQSCTDYSLFMFDLEESRAGLKGTRLAASDIRQYVVDVMIPEVRNTMEGQ